jgi:DNA-binding transcriptional MocR family regulator
MTFEWEMKYCERASCMYGSMTRQLMHLIADPEVISFGGGLPAWELFPVEQVKEVTNYILDSDGPAALQYGTSEGYKPLRQAVAERYRKKGFDITEDNVLITCGSQQGIDLVSKLFLDKGATLVVGDPTFLMALQTFSLFQAECLTVPLDEEGMRVGLLPEILEQNDVKFIYVMPNFQNPSGVTLSLERRKRLVEIAQRYGVPILEDDAYGELRYSGEALPALKVLDKGQQVIYLGSFSKVLSPGLRVSALVAPDGVMEKLVFAKQAADLHTDNLAQRIVYEFLCRDLLDPHIQVIINSYRKRRDAMLQAMERYFRAGVSWTKPDGGIFLWVTLPQGMDAMGLFEKAIQAKVAYVPGSCYYANGGGDNSMRVNFSACDEGKIEVGIQRLAKVITENLK